MGNNEIVGEEIIHQSGSYKRIKRWLKGWHPTLGVLTWGFSGKETIVEMDVITPFLKS